MLVDFIITIEVEDDLEFEVTKKQAAEFDRILLDIEEVIGKTEYCLDDSKWEAL